MKIRLTALSLAAGLGLTALAQDTPPPATPAPPAVPVPPAPPTAPPVTPPPPATPGLLPPAQGLPVEEPDSFKSEKERQSYAVGWLFGTREKQSAGAAASPELAADEVLAGMKDVLSGGKSADYAVGAMMAMQIKRAQVDMDPETLFAAVRDALTSQPAKLSSQQQQLVLQRVQADVSARSEARRKVEQEKQLKVANEFLAANGKTEGVKTTASGLQYKIEKEGDGKTATEGDIVTINFNATVSDGTEFEKSPPGAPARKAVRTLPKGMQEALTILKTGGKGKFWLPPAIGFGDAGRPPQVKGSAVLVYEVEFVSVEPLPKPPPVTGANPNQPSRGPITAVTPPITVEIPPKPGEKPAEPPKTPAPGTNPTPPPPPPPAPPVPPPAPPK